MTVVINANYTEYMSLNVTANQDYVNAVIKAIDAGRYAGPLTPVCPECSSNFADLDEAHEDVDHIIIATTSDTTAVIIGCEGYFMVNPNEVGIDSPNWQDWAVLPDDVTADDFA